MIFKIFLIFINISLIRSHTHDEISKCSLTGIYKTRQTILESPNYPSNYTAGTCWDYVIRSPYRCPTKFHIQFLDFFLEASENCANDYLAIGLDNIDDDMDVLCGQVVGIKKYHTPDGVLRLRFYADDSKWSTGKGFKLLITRLACEKEELLRELADNTDDDDDTITVTAPQNYMQLPEKHILELFRNLSGKDQYQMFPLNPAYAVNYPTQLPVPPYPAYGGFYLPQQQPFVPQQNQINSIANTDEKPCKGQKHAHSQLQQQQQLPYLPSYITNTNSYLPTTGEQYVGTWPSSPVYNPIRARDGSSPSVEACCTSGFQQKRFYLSSPGFPRTIFSNLLPTERRDCEFRLQKHTSNVCRLRVDFKFFDFGQSFQGTGSFQGNIGLPAIETSKNTCTDDYIEIDNERFCGCRSDHVYTAYWNYQGDKKIRMRMGHSGIPSGGFLLELTQEECSETQFGSTTFGPDTRPLAGTTSNPNRYLNNNNLLNYPNSQGYLPQSPTQFLQQPGAVQQSPYPAYPGQHNFAQNPFNNVQGIFNNQQQNPLQQHLQIPNNVYQPLPPAPLNLGYQQHPLATQNPIQQNPINLQQLRYARSYDDNKPVTVVETNSTRKEYYFQELNSHNSYDSNLNSNEAISRSSRLEGIQRWDDDYPKSTAKAAALKQKCSFDMGDILRLSVDVLWLTKPTCYAPQRSWLTNWLG